MLPSSKCNFEEHVPLSDLLTISVPFTLASHFEMTFDSGVEVSRPGLACGTLSGVQKLDAYVDAVGLGFQHATAHHLFGHI